MANLGEQDSADASTYISVSLFLLCHHTHFCFESYTLLYIRIEEQELTLQSLSIATHDLSASAYFLISEAIQRMTTAPMMAVPS